MRPVELTRSGVLGTLGVIVVVAVCIRLGLWQLDRRAGRLERNRAVAARMTAEPTTLRSAPSDTVGLTFHRVRIEGELDPDRAVILAGRSHGGAPGVHLVVPLRTPGGAVLVNLGWLPSPDAASAEPPPLPRGPVWVEGVLLPFPDVDLDLPPGGFRTTWFRLDGDALRAQYPYRVAGLYLQATDRPTGQESPTRPAQARQPVILEPPSLGAGPHLSYAIQWFSFAAIFAIGWVVLLVRGGGRDGRPRESPGT